MQRKRRHETVVFSHDKNGRKVAYYVGADMRLFRMTLATAEFEVATGTATDESAGWVDYFKRLHNARAIRDGKPLEAGKRCDSCNDFCWKVGGSHGC